MQKSFEKEKNHPTDVEWFITKNNEINPIPEIF